MENSQLVFDFSHNSTLQRVLEREGREYRHIFAPTLQLCPIFDVGMFNRRLLHIDLTKKLMTGYEKYVNSSLIGVRTPSVDVFIHKKQQAIGLLKIEICANSLDNKKLTKEKLVINLQQKNLIISIARQRGNRELFISSSMKFQFFAVQGQVQSTM